jgi:hypothetical protein
MRAYIAYDEGGIEELGDVGKDQVLILIDKAEASLSSAKQFGVGFCRSEKDFLEVRPVGKSQYMLWSDLIIKAQSKGLGSFFSRRKTHIDTIVDGREAAADVVDNYMNFSREEFERKYS